MLCTAIQSTLYSCTEYFKSYLNLSVNALCCHLTFFVDCIWAYLYSRLTELKKKKKVSYRVSARVNWLILSAAVTM